MKTKMVRGRWIKGTEIAANDTLIGGLPEWWCGLKIVKVARGCVAESRMSIADFFRGSDYADLHFADGRVNRVWDGFNYRIVK